MTNCLPSFSTSVLTPSGGCAVDCTGVSYDVIDVVTDMTAQGSCSFRYSLRRSPDNELFSGTEVVSCPAMKTLTFYCGDDDSCPIFELVLKCIQDIPPTGN